ncbi:CYFA0S15e01706g1_1 [Cyberlindnera fabianii]|uniref:CYFA0S15e01706g1_1 n=1 Tax=Cyberlindnera fabianii TaxID=36022 RepID=A0A061BCL2_CYBFA|nr:CYFA0S15e01706g1_1 [Cyberlindnera fabianii]
MAIFPKLTSTLSNGALAPHSSHSQTHNHSPGSSSPAITTNNLAHTSSHPFELSIDLESPPIIMYGLPNESTGSLLSGQLVVDIPKEAFQSQRPSNKRTLSSGGALNQLQSTLSNLNITPSQSHSASPLTSANNSSTNLVSLLNMKDHILMNSIQLILVQKVHYAKPFLPPSNTLATCNSCKKKSTELARWDIMSQAHNLPVGKHSYPFSHLLPGALPATTCLGSSGITSIKYELVAIASYNNHSNHQSMCKVVLPINISRSILRGPDRNSLRVFPPTDVTATAVLPNVIYPRSSFALELKLDGVSSAERRWRMRRVAWRIEETVKVKGNACINHKSKLRVVEEHVRKNQHLTKTNVKRNQQSGPTTQVVVSNTAQNDLTPSASNAALQPQQSNADGIASHPADNDDDISSTADNTLHPSDHANEELRQQQQQQLQQQDEQKKEAEYALYCEETRTVASGDLRNGWKSDFSDKGKIELVAHINCFNLSSAAGQHHSHSSSKHPVEQPMIHPTVSCDIDDPVLGITASHVLIVEVVIAEEIPQNASTSSLTPSSSHTDKKEQGSDQRLAELSPVFANHIKPSQSAKSDTASRKSDDATTGPQNVVGVPTGSARVLRMQFKLNITERSGLGIAWDDEVPPMYGDVSALSPPTYETAMSPEFSPNVDVSNPPLYPLNPAHTHTHLNGTPGTSTPGVIYGIGNTPGITPRQSSQFQSLNGALEHDDFTLN